MQSTYTTLQNDEIFNLAPTDLAKLITEIKEVDKNISGMAISIVGVKLFEIAGDYDLDDIGINPHYEYNDEGFSGNFMISFDGEDVHYNGNDVPKKTRNAKKISYRDLQEKIDNELAQYSFLIKEDMGFNIRELRISLHKDELDKTVSTKEGKTVARYKL